MYDRWSDQYNHCGNPMLLATDEILSELVPDLTGAHLVEFGCGTARNYALYQLRGASSVVGLDFSEGMLSQARQHYPEFRFVLHDVSTPTTLTGSSFDVAVFSLVLEHMQDLAPCFIEARRLLKSGGSLLLCEMHPFLGLQGAGAHFHDADGTKVHASTFVHSLSDLIEAALEQGFVLQAIRESKSRPGSTKWMGSPLAVAMRFGC